MREQDFDAFSALLDDTAALLQRPGQQPLTPTARAMYFRALAAHPLNEVRAALDAHVRDPQRGRFFPMPADLIAQLQGLAADDGRPGPEEAWAIAVRSTDEAETVVWTDDMAKAWAAAKPVLDMRDEVGARMAFREAYNRIVEDARRQREPIAWTASLGHDTKRRADALRQAVDDGRLPQSTLHGLPAPNARDFLQLGFDAPSAGASEAEILARQRLRELAERLRTAMPAVSADAIARAETASLKAESAALAGHSLQPLPNDEMRGCDDAADC